MESRLPTLLWQDVCLVIILALVYFFTGLLGANLALPPGFSTPVFPASGIALAFVIWKGYRIWPGVLIGSFCMNTWISHSNIPEFSLITFFPIGIGIALGATGEALAGAYLFRRLSSSNNPFDQVKNVLIFLIVSGLISSVVSASVGTVSLCLGNLADWNNFSGFWLTWWLGDAMGIWLFAPLVLIFTQPASYTMRPVFIIEGIFIAAIIYLFSLTVFSGIMGANTYPLLFITYPLLIWAIFRFEQFGAVFSVLIISIVAILETVKGNNPFTLNMPPHESLLLLQTFTSIMSFTSLVLASSLTEKKQLEKSLKKNATNLEDHVEQRTSQLEETSLLLQENKRFLETLIENLPGIVYCNKNDESWTLEYISDGCYDLTGYSAEQLLNKNISVGRDIIHPKDQQRVRLEVQKSLQKRHSFKVTYRIITANNELKWVWDQGLGIYSKNGDLEALEGFVIDITQQKNSESKLNFYAEELKRSNQDLEEFAYLASHDMQEPLRKIITFSDRLKEKDDSLNEEAKDYLSRMQKAAFRMSNYIRDLLEYSKATQQQKKYERVSLEKIVTQVIEDLSDQIKNQNATVHRDELPTLEVEPVQFPKAIQNLISNALKYHRKGVFPIINITSSFLEKAKKWQIEVSDNGIGIEDKYFDRIFKPFERLHGRSEFEGSGIGLAICKKIIHRHNGMITVQKNLPHGTTFIITLPEKQKPTT